MSKPNFQQMTVAQLIAYLKINGIDDSAFNELLIKTGHPQARPREEFSRT